MVLIENTPPWYLSHCLWSPAWLQVLYSAVSFLRARMASHIPRSQHFTWHIQWLIVDWVNDCILVQDYLSSYLYVATMGCCQVGRIFLHPYFWVNNGIQLSFCIRTNPWASKLVMRSRISMGIGGVWDIKYLVQILWSFSSVCPAVKNSFYLSIS
jgi:hypothetical protein